MFAAVFIIKRAPRAF